jgi:hypothetical protein
MKPRSRARSYTYCVWMNCAPAATFLASRSARCSSGGTIGFSPAPNSTRGEKLTLRPLWKAMLVAQHAADFEQRHRIQVEHRLGLRMIARLYAIAGQAQHVAHPHRRAAQDVALDRDPVAVAAGDLHHRRVADARQQCAHRQARHVAIRARAVGGVDGVDVAVEHARACVDIRGSAESGGASSVVTANTPARSTRSKRPGDTCPGRIGSG